MLCHGKCGEHNAVSSGTVEVLLAICHGVQKYDCYGNAIAVHKQI